MLKTPLSDAIHGGHKTAQLRVSLAQEGYQTHASHGLTDHVLPCWQPCSHTISSMPLFDVPQRIITSDPDPFYVLFLVYMRLPNVWSLALRCFMSAIIVS